MQGLRIVKAGGICLVILALLMTGIDIFNELLFKYPTALEGQLPITLTKVMPFVMLREILLVQSLLPLLLIPGAVGLFYHLRDECPGAMNVALCFALVASVAWIIGLMIWPSLNWYVAQGYIEDKYIYHSHVIQMMIGGLTALFHLFIGMYLKVVALSLWVFLVCIAGLKHKALWGWLCWLGVILAVAAWVFLIFQALFAPPTLVLESFSLFPLVYFWLFLVGVNMIYKDVE